MANLDQRIGTLRGRLAWAYGRPDADGRGTLTDGSTVVLDFGNGREAFLFSELGGEDDIERIAPSSPLGRAIAGAAVGELVRYMTSRGEATVRLTRSPRPQPPGAVPWLQQAIPRQRRLERMACGPAPADGGTPRQADDRLRFGDRRVHHGRER